MLNQAIPGDQPSSWSRILGVAAAFFRVGLRSAIAYRGEALVWVLATTMPFVMLLLWLEVGRQGGLGNGFVESHYVNYFLIAFCIRQMAGTWVAWKINLEVKSGQLSLRLLRPVHLFVSFASEEFAMMNFRSLVSVPPAMVLLLWFGGEGLPRSPWTWLAVATSTLAAWLITFFLNMMIGLLSLFTAQSLKVMELWIAVFFVLSGYLIPLTLFPPSVRSVLEFLPFRYQVGLPIELASGALPLEKAWSALSLQWMYVAVFALMAQVVYRQGVKRFEAYGG
jgi:ABC-2 type transport system permease protein